MNEPLNILRIKIVANALKELNENIVFVGGAVVSLYTDGIAAEDIRPTEDVDVIVELAAYKDFVALENKLRLIGFVNDIESGVICRYKIQGVIVDIMPTLTDVLGFSNKWYPEGFANAIIYKIR